MQERLGSLLVNVIWRTLMTFWAAHRRARRGQTLPMNGLSRIRVRTLPTDIDFLRHMNNGRYLSLFDLGRWDLLVRTGMFAVMKKHGWYAVVAAETVTFRKSLSLWQAFDIESRMIGHDARSVYLEHRAVVDGEVYAQVIVRSRILRRTGGSVPHEEVLAAMGATVELPEIARWVREWADASALPSTKRPAPSVWSWDI